MNINWAHTLRLSTINRMYYNKTPIRSKLNYRVSPKRHGLFAVSFEVSQKWTDHGSCFRVVVGVLL